MADEVKKTALDTLNSIIGFDASKDAQADVRAGTSGVFDEVLKTVREERDAEIKAKAIVLFKDAITRAKSLAKIKSDFDKLYRKEEGELVKLVKRIEAMSRGEAPPIDEGEKKED